MKRRIISTHNALKTSSKVVPVDDCPVVPKKENYAKKKPVIIEIVAVLSGRREKRGLNLIHPISRAVSKGEIHELLMTDEQSAGPGKIVDHVAGIGFFEVESGGVILVGDHFSIDGKVIGEVAGFDETHFPNHMNFVMKSNERKTGVELGVEVGDRIIIGGNIKEKQVP